MTWDPSFFRKSPLFWPIAPHAAALAGFAEWPDPSDLSRALAAALPVRLERAAPKPRRGRAPVSEARYDARIAVDGVVPTRARSWHDLLNALVWASFPRAKTALHARQHRMIAERLEGGSAARLPGARTPEQDAVAMLDEGGIALLCAQARGPDLASALARDARGELAELVASGAALPVIFGHAIYEGLACGGPAGVRAAAYVVPVDAIPGDAPGAVAAADTGLAALLARDAPIGRGDLTSLVVDAHLARAVQLRGERAVTAEA